MEEIFEGVFGFENHEELMNEMMNEYGQDILRLVYSYVNNKEVAEDLTQDIFVKFYKSLHTFKGKSKLKTWLWRIAINHCKDFLKSWYTKHVSIAEDTIYIKTKKEMVEEIIIQKEAEDQLISAIMSLPIKYREVIGLMPTLFNAFLIGVVLSVYRRKDLVSNSYMANEVRIK